MSEEFHLICDTKELAKILNFAVSVVEKKNTIPILSHIKMQLEDNKLVLTATDMNLSLSQTIGAEVKSPGAITVNNQIFSDVVRKINDKNMEIQYSSETSQIDIRSQNCEVNLSTLPAEDFPSMDSFESKLSFEISAKLMLALLEYTKFAASTEETRYNLNGVYFHTTRENGSHFLTAVATDGHRLAIYKSTYEIGEEFGAILPRKTVNELCKILKDTQILQENIKIFLGRNRIMFATRDKIMISKLVDTSFPDYSIFVPTNNPNKLTISARLFADSVDRVATVATNTFPAIKIVLMEDNIEMEAYGESRGLAHEIIPIQSQPNQSYSGNDITIGFNPRYILEILSVLGEDIVTIALLDSRSSVILTSQNHPEIQFMIMPVKI